MEKICEMEKISEVFDFIKAEYPEWIIFILDEYSKDYNFLNDNWTFITQNLNTKKQKIVIVKNFEKDEYVKFAELLTKTGFVVRTEAEFSACAKCHSAIPTYVIYEIMLKNNKFVPSVWSPTCSKC